MPVLPLSSGVDGCEERCESGGLVGSLVGGEGSVLSHHGWSLRNVGSEVMRSCAQRVPWKARAPLNRSSTRVRSSSTDWKASPASHAVLLQGFHWESCDAQSQGKSWYEIVKENVDLIAESGMTDVWLPPPSQSVAPQGYLPSKLYALDSEYGTQKELQDLIQALHARGVRAICDVVINHRCADKQDAEGKWTVFTEPDWEAWAIVGDDKTQWYWGSGGADTGADYAAAPDIDHTNAQVRESLKKWLNWLKDEVGFDGWRFDFVRGFAPHFVKEYVESSLGGSMDEHVVVGEFWDSGGPWQLHEFVNSTGMACGAFDFPLKGELQNAMGNHEYWRLGKSFDGRSPGLMGVLPERAFTFVEVSFHVMIYPPHSRIGLRFGICCILCRVCADGVVSFLTNCLEP